MKFEIKYNKHPENGDVRNILKFAWLPTKVDQSHLNKRFIIWLEKYHARQICCEGMWFTISTWIGQNIDECPKGDVSKP